MNRVESLPFDDAEWAGLTPAQRARALVEQARQAGPIIGQLDDDGVEEAERQFLPDPPIAPSKRLKVHPWFTGPRPS